MSSRLSVARNVLRQGALAGDDVPLKVSLEEEVFAESLAAGRVAVALCARDGGAEVCGRLPLQGAEAVRVVRFPTGSATRFDLPVRFALLESEEPVLFSPAFVLGRPATEEELTLALTELERDAVQRSPSSPKPPPATGSSSESSSPRGAGWVAARSPTAAVFSNPSSPRSPRSPRTVSPRARSQSSASSPAPAGRPTSGSIPLSSSGTVKAPRSILRTRKAPHAFQVGQTVLGMCHLNDEWRKCIVRGVSDLSACVYFEDIALEQEDTPFDQLQPLKSGARLGGSISLESTDFCSSSAEEDLSPGVESPRESPKSRGIGFARVTRDFVALRAGQMSVKKGTVVDVIDIVNKDWTLCEAGEERGLVPANALNNPKP